MALTFYVWFTVIVSILVQKSFGNQCLEDNNMSCDECIRCGGIWCNKPGSDHCDLLQNDEGRCPSHEESLISISPVSKDGDLVRPIYAEMTLYIGQPHITDIQYTARTEQKPNITITNSTQSFNINIKVSDTTCSSGLNCKTQVEASPTTDFCFNDGGTHEYVYVEVGVGGLSQNVVLKYHVSCACDCSTKFERDSVFCSKNGYLSCGKCTCNPGWFGDNCSKPLCVEASRGDVPCASKGNVQCSGNGYCGPCETCVCYTDRVGSQYFDPENECTDICTVVSYCDTCLVNDTLGRCYECQTSSLYVQKYNESVLGERDYLNRTVWVNCNETVGDCYVSYVAMKERNDDIFVMVVESCNTVISGGRGAESKVSIALAVLGVLAVVAAAGGVLYWHHMNAAAPVALNNPGYQNIVAEGSSGQNPLYKDPWSSFKNPMYGDKS